ncbi:MAG TPA: hypothetical protein VLK33_09890 [Terriglobales bacterium]|nr:hypothetical protein [Terriglobales bacterium]
MPVITADDSAKSGVTNADTSADMNDATSAVMNVAMNVTTIAITVDNRLQVDPILR